MKMGNAYKCYNIQCKGILCIHNLCVVYIENSHFPPSPCGKMHLHSVSKKCWLFLIFFNYDEITNHKSLDSNYCFALFNTKKAEFSLALCPSTYYNKIHLTLVFMVEFFNPAEIHELKLNWSFKLSEKQIILCRNIHRLNLILEYWLFSWKSPGANNAQKIVNT